MAWHLQPLERQTSTPWWPGTRPTRPPSARWCCSPGNGHVPLCVPCRRRVVAILEQNFQRESVRIPEDEPMGTNAELYEQDFYAWCLTTAALIREGQWCALDREALAEEVESLAKRDRRALRRRLQLVLMHLLKWRYQPLERSGSWRRTIRTQRTAIREILTDSPSLRPTMMTILTQRYPHAREDARDEAGRPLATCPEACPWTPDQVLDADFWPEGEPTP